MAQAGREEKRGKWGKSKNLIDGDKVELIILRDGICAVKAEAGVRAGVGAGVGGAE